jgi:DNA-nicking Smr family endonuclease
MSEQDDEKDLFLKHMSGVKPLKKSKKVTPPKVISQKPLISKKKEAYQAPAYQGNLHISQDDFQQKIQKTKKFREGTSINANIFDEELITSEAILSFNLDKLGPPQQQKLIKGLITPHAKIDLHGLERFEAQERLERFINHAYQNQNRYLLVIHGKGGKHGETPILKQHLYHYLRLHPKILTLHSAHPKHGGSGALYVVLKKQK